MFSSKDKISIKNCGNLKKILLLKDLARNTITKVEKKNIGRLYAKVEHNQFDRTHCRSGRPRSSRTANTIAAIKYTVKVKL